MNEYYINQNNHYFKIIKINGQEIREEITQEEFYELYLS